MNFFLQIQMCLLTVTEPRRRRELGALRGAGMAEDGTDGGPSKRARLAGETHTMVVLKNSCPPVALLREGEHHHEVMVRSVDFPEGVDPMDANAADQVTVSYTHEPRTVDHLHVVSSHFPDEFSLGGNFRATLGETPGFALIKEHRNYDGTLFRLVEVDTLGVVDGKAQRFEYASVAATEGLAIRRCT